MKMNCFSAIALLAFIVSVQALTEEYKQKLDAAKKECLASTGVDIELVKKAKWGEFIDDATLKEFAFCLGKKQGFVSEAGEYQVDVIGAKVTEEIGAEKADEVMQACTGKSFGNGLENSFELVKCYFQVRKASLI